MKFNYKTINEYLVEQGLDPIKARTLSTFIDTALRSGGLDAELLSQTVAPDYSAYNATAKQTDGEEFHVVYEVAKLDSGLVGYTVKVKGNGFDYGIDRVEAPRGDEVYTQTDAVVEADVAQEETFEEVPTEEQTLPEDTATGEEPGADAPLDNADAEEIVNAEEVIIDAEEVIEVPTEEVTEAEVTEVPEVTEVVPAEEVAPEVVEEVPPTPEVTEVEPTPEVTTPTETPEVTQKKKTTTKKKDK